MTYKDRSAPSQGGEPRRLRKSHENQLSPLRDKQSNFWLLVKRQGVGKSVQEVSKHRIALAAVLRRKLLMLRHAPGRARTCNPMIRSHILQLLQDFRSFSIFRRIFLNFSNRVIRLLAKRRQPLPKLQCRHACSERS